MPIPIYCTAKKKGNYLRLLHFSRITSFPPENAFSENYKKTTTESLNLSLETLNPSLRPLLPLIYYNGGQAGLRNSLTHTKEKIPVILLKGAAFAGTIYPSNAPRVGVDIDILVTEEKFEAACEHLCKSMNPLLLSSERVATHDSLFERVFTPQDDHGPTVEIHRGLTNPSIFNINEQSLWAASKKHPAYNSELIRILSPEDTLLHLAVHAFRDLDFCTHNILDAHEIWCQWKPDPKILGLNAKHWGAKKVLYYLLANCKTIMGTPVPDTLLQSLQPTSLVNRLNKKILQSRIVEREKNNSWRYRLIQLLSQITFPDRVIRGIKFQTDYARTRLADWLIARKNI